MTTITIMSNIGYWLSLLVNGGFALLFFNRLISTDYSEYRPFVYYFDGLCFAMNLAAFVLTITG